MVSRNRRWFSTSVRDNKRTNIAPPRDGSLDSDRQGRMNDSTKPSTASFSSEASASSLSSSARQSAISGASLRMNTDSNNASLEPK